MLWSRGVGIRLAELPEALLEGVLLCHPNTIALAWREVGIQFLCYPSHGLLIDGFDVLGPPSQLLVVGKIVFELMHVAEEMNPTALVQTLMDVVSRIKIAAQHPLK